MAPTPEPDRQGDNPLLDPSVALLPGRGDTIRLLAIWLVRRSFIWLLMLGIIIGVLVAEAANEDAALFVDTSSAETIAEGVFTRFGLVFAAVVIRILATWIAVVLAYPVTRANQGPPDATRTLRARLDARLDELDLARAFAALRWTRPVRDAALARLGNDGRWFEVSDRMVGWANQGSVAACVLVILVFGAQIQA